MDDPAVAGTPFEGGEYFTPICSVSDATINRIYTTGQFRVWLFEARRPIAWVELQHSADARYRYCGATRMGADPSQTEITNHVIRISGGQLATAFDVQFGYYVKNLTWGDNPSDGYLVFGHNGWERRDGFRERPFIFYFNWEELASVQHTPMYSVRVVIDRMESGGVEDIPQGF